jgi:hypothetical protein
MFIQVIQGRAVNPAGVRGQMDRWKAELAPGASSGSIRPSRSRVWQRSSA